jgi:8-oxo-dGTP diphosphatase
MVINATLCYVRHNNHTLMLRRSKKKNDIHTGKWNGLGGKFEIGETPEECARREILEESGLSVSSLRMKGILTFPCFDGENDWIVFVFLTRNFTGSLIDSPEGDLQWIPDNALLNLPLWEGDTIFLPWLDRNVFFSGKFIYSKGKLLGHSVVFYE